MTNDEEKRIKTEKVRGNVLVHKITNCARCGKDHTMILFVAFKKSCPEEWTHWATCPETKDPIIMVHNDI